MTILFSNNASTTITGAITSASTTVALAPGTGVSFPNPTGGNYYVATFYDQATKTINEIVHVTAMSGDTATIVRAQEGTTAKAWNSGDIFANLITAGTLNAFVQAGTGPANTSIIFVGTDASPTVNYISCPTNPVPSGMATGMQFNIWVKNSNTGPVTANFNSEPSHPVLRSDGSQLVAGNLIAGQEYAFIYNGASAYTSAIPPIPQAPPQTVFYVRPDGNDSNSGLANTPAAAFLTIQGAINAIKSRYISQLQVTVNVADGTYTGGGLVTTNYIASWNFVGDTTTPSACIIDATSTSSGSYVSGAPLGDCFQAVGPAVINVSGFTFKSYGANVVAEDGGTMNCTGNNYSAPTGGGSCIYAIGGSMGVYGTNAFSPGTGCSSIFNATENGLIEIGYHSIYATRSFSMNIQTATSFGIGTATADTGGVIALDNTVTSWSGYTPTSPQYTCSTAGGIWFSPTAGPGFPGTIAGTVTSPGWTH